MIRFVADENFNNNIVRGWWGRLKNTDVVRVQDVGLYGASDPDVLEWAAKSGRVLLTHDLSTIPPLALDRVRSGKVMPEVILVSQHLPVGQVIDELILVSECSLDGEWEGQIRYLPIV